MNSYISEEIFVEQPSGFENHSFSNHVFKLNKILYGLKQAPRVWYKKLSRFLLDNKFNGGSVDTTLFLKKKNNDLLIVQVYVDDIIFGAINEDLCQEFIELIQKKFEMSMIGEQTFF